jgi:hypothetical protein
MKIVFLILFLLIETICIGQKQNKPDSFSGAIPYDTIQLTKGYTLRYATKQDINLLRLTGPAIDTILYSCNSRSYSGRLEADFDDYFVLYWDGIPPGMRIIKKENGSCIVNDVGIDVDTTNKIVYYLNFSNKHICLFFPTTGRTEEYPQPINVPCLWWPQCIISKKLDEKNLTLVYAGKKNTKLTRVYPRQKD